MKDPRALPGYVACCRTCDGLEGAILDSPGRLTATSRQVAEWIQSNYTIHRWPPHANLPVWCQCPQEQAPLKELPEC